METKAKKQAMRLKNAFIFAQKVRAFIIILLVLLEILRGLRNIFLVNMVKRNGNVKSALKNMQCNLTGKLIRKPVAQKSINVTVVQSSPGGIAL